MKFKVKDTGVILEPATEEVEAMMLANPNLEKVGGEKPKATRKRAAKPKE